jgi:type IV secretion system protein TrbL
MRKVAIPIAVLLVALPAAAHAQDAGGVVDQVVRQFQGAMAGWEGTLQTIAEATFGILALINLALNFGRLVLQKADLSEFLTVLVQQILYLGLFWWLLTAFNTWNPAIIHSFTQAAGQASGQGTMSPGDVAALGVNIFEQVVALMSVWHPEAAAALAIFAVIILACFALICATMVLALVQGYFIGSAGVLFMAFGGAELSKDLAISVVRATLGIGARLYALRLIVAIGMTFMQQQMALFGNVTAAGVAVAILESLVLLVVSWEIPAMLERMVGGVGFAHGGALLGAAAGVAGAAATAGKSAVGAATSVAGAGAAVGSAAGAASRQISNVGRSPAERVAAIAGRAISTTAKAAANDIGRRLAGQSMGRGSMGWRMAADIGGQPPAPGRP